MAKERLQIERDLDGMVWLGGWRPHAHSMHTHDELEMNLVVRGSSVYLINGRRYDLKLHCLLWLFPDDPHAIVETTPDFQAWIVVFKQSMLRQVCRTEEDKILLNRSSDRESPRQLLFRRATNLSQLCEDLRENHDNPGPFNAGLRYLLLKSWQETRKTDMAPASLPLHVAVFKAATLLSEEPGIANMKELSRRAGLSSAHLSRLFRQQMGQSLTDYRNQQRLERFLQLREQTSRTVTESAYEAGFGSYAQFYRVYHHRFGNGPEGRRIASLPYS